MRRGLWGSRAVIAIAAVALVNLLSFARGAPAPTSFPTKPVRLVVPTAPGGGVDTSARILAQKLTEAWGQQVIVDNRGGGSGVIGAEIVARAPPDGHTLLIAPTTFSTTRSLVKKLAYDPLRDFTPISLISREPNVLMVHPVVSAGSVQELVAVIRARPDALDFGAGGVGSTAALCAELFKLRTGTRPAVLSYKGAGPAVNALVAGEVQTMFIGLPPTLPLLKADKLRALAVTARERSSFLPGVPTMAEAGVRDFEVSNWIGVLAPAGTANRVVRQINEDTRRVLESDVVRERFKLHGVVPEPGSPEEFARFLRGEIDRWDKVIKAAKITLD